MRPLIGPNGQPRGQIAAPSLDVQFGKELDKGFSPSAGRCWRHPIVVTSFGNTALAKGLRQAAGRGRRLDWRYVDRVARLLQIRELSGRADKGLRYVHDGGAQVLAQALRLGIGPGRGCYAFLQESVDHNVERTQVGQLESLYAQLRSLRAEEPTQPLEG